jgi:RNA polymerase sigma factor (sigma-70 family)
MTDWALLQEYALGRKEEAFRQLVDRHVHLVYSAAVRQLRSPHLAEEVAQSAFIELAEHAARLGERTVLPAWLYEVTRRKAIDVIRREQRRIHREQAATEMNTAHCPDSNWTELAPVLDEAMAELESSDRAALILRFFEDKSLREVGQALGTSDDTAQKRVTRAVDRLRRLLASRGIHAGAAAITAALSANAIQAAPAGLALAIGSAAIAAGGAAFTAGSGALAVGTTAAAVANPGPITLAHSLLMTTTQKALVGSALFLTVCTGIYEAVRVSNLKQQLRVLSGQHAPLTHELHRLREDHQRAVRNLAALQHENDRLRSNTAELPKLRGELTQLRAAAQNRDTASPAESESAEAELKSWLARVSELKERLQTMPDHRVPEFELLTDQDWLDAAKREIRNDIDLRRAFSKLRNTAQGKFAVSAHSALKDYMEAHDGAFPNELADLQPYLKSPVSQSILDNWQIIPASELRNLGMGGEKVITQKRAVDEVFDTRIGLGPYGHGSTDFLSSTAGATFGELHAAYQAVYPGRTPKDPSELIPFAKTRTQQEVLQKFLERKAASE